MRIKSIASLALLALSLGGCSDRAEREPVVIHVYRDPTATVVESALLAVGARQLKSSSGQTVMIATIEPKSYPEGLDALGHQYHPELVIFNSLEDGEKTGVPIPPQSSVQVGAKQFYPVIPSWVPGEKRQAAGLVLVELRKELQKATPPVTGPTH